MNFELTLHLYPTNVAAGKRKTAGSGSAWYPLLLMPHSSFCKMSLTPVSVVTADISNDISFINKFLVFMNII